MRYLLGLFLWLYLFLNFILNQNKDSDLHAHKEENVDGASSYEFRGIVLSPYVT